MPSKQGPTVKLDLFKKKKKKKKGGGEKKKEQTLKQNWESLEQYRRFMRRF